jgi:hypothetical protein
MYHDEFGSEFGLAINFTVELIILFYPIHWGNRYCNAFVSLGVIIVGDDKLISLIDDLPGLFLVYFHVRLLIHSFHRYN